MTETPTPTRPRPGDSDYVINRRPPTEDEQRIADATGRGLNPDTNAPFPSPSRVQTELVAELLAKLGRRPDPDDLIAQALTEAVVRQHGRTLRDCLGELRNAAADQESEARRRLTLLGDDGPSDEWVLPAAEHAHAARALRRVHLYGRSS